LKPSFFFFFFKANDHFFPSKFVDVEEPSITKPAHDFFVGYNNQVAQPVAAPAQAAVQK